MDTLRVRVGVTAMHHLDSTGINGAVRRAAQHVFVHHRSVKRTAKELRVGEDEVPKLLEEAFRSLP